MFFGNISRRDAFFVVDILVQIGICLLFWFLSSLHTKLIVISFVPSINSMLSIIFILHYFDYLKIKQCKMIIIDKMVIFNYHATLFGKTSRVIIFN
jgi:hypothetical protein